MSIFEETKRKILENGLIIASFDFNKPWGGFFVIEEAQAQKFADVFLKA